jgi:hypothetical protein
MFMGLLDPNPDSLSSSKHSKKPLDSYCFVTFFFDLLSLKNYVNVPSKSKKQKNVYPDPNPDSLVRGMDPRIRIHTKMSWIRNTDQKTPVSSVRLELDAALCACVALLHEAHFRANVEEEPAVPRLQLTVILAQRVQPRSHTPTAYPGGKKYVRNLSAATFILIRIRSDLEFQLPHTDGLS